MNLIIKFGGAVVTRKYKGNFPLDIEEIKTEGEKFIRKNTIKRLIRELYEAHKKNPFNFVLINGAGPFGHLLVYEYLRGRKIEIETIHKSVALLNSKIVKELERYFQVTGVAPFETCYFENGNFDIRKLKEITENEFKNNHVISTYGDIVPAKNGRLGNYEVISGDDIAVNLASSLKADKIIMLTDVDGIFTKDPIIHKDAKLIPELNPTTIDIDFTRSKIDVTGGMASKVRKLSLAARNGISSHVINGTIQGNLLKLLSWKQTGTKIEYKYKT